MSEVPPSPARVAPVRQAALAVALAGLLVASACGSTAPGTADTAAERHRPGSTSADEFGADLDTTTGNDPTIRTGNDPTASTGNHPTAGAVTKARGANGSSAGREEAGPAPAVDGPGTGPTPVGAGVPGVTNDTIYVGMVDVDLAALADAVGAAGGQRSAEGRTRDIGEAIAADINEHGGIAGRRLEIVWHNVASPAEYATPEGRRRDQQRACATWTEDNEVFAFLSQPLVDEVIYDCARRNNVVVVPEYIGLAVDEEYFGTMRHLWYSLTRMITDRRDRNLVENLVRRGVLTPDAKVGIMVEDWGPARRGVESGMEPALAAHGIEVVAKAVYPDFVESPWDTYILQFRSAGVTHVLFAQTWDGQAFPVLFMMRAAENQNWRPTWGLGSDNLPDEVARAGVSRAQLANTFALGWSPERDLGRYDETSASTRCAEIAQDPIGNDSDERWLTFCDVLFFFQAALNRAPEVSPAGVNAAVGALGNTYESIAAIGGRTSFGADRHDGVAVQRDLVYNPECRDGTNCFRYTGEPRPMP